MLHKTGSRAVESEGLTTQRWAVLGALSRPEADGGMAVGHLASHLRVSRQSLAGVVRPLEADGLIDSEPDPTDGRSRLLRLTPSGRDRWVARALPRIEAFYDEAVVGLSVEDLSHALHYLVRLLDNMTAIDLADRATTDRAATADEASRGAAGQPATQGRSGPTGPR